MKKEEFMEGGLEIELEYGQKLADAPPGEEVVITGLSGCFPNSRNVQEFQSNLYNGTDMVSDDDRRWSLNHPEIPKRSGIIHDIEKFDAGFFGLHQRQVDSADPIVRIFLEKTIEAIMDAGINPSELEGTNCGVFVGTCASETQIIKFIQPNLPQSFSVTGNHKTMTPNRISYYLKLKGPSLVLDTACSSSLYAIENAYRAIRNGTCDSAIVAGTNLCLHPFITLQFARLGVLSLDGCCKVFDNNGNGYVRSEAIVVVFLQKSRNAKRIYGRIVHAKTNCDGYKEQSITFPSSSDQKTLLQKFYRECSIDPKSLSYLEAHGTGTKIGDPEEIRAIDSVFCNGRKTPLLIGGVKSNIGHSEPASGVCSIAKVIIGAENGLIPPNIHFSKFREGLTSFEKGRLKVVAKPTPFEDNRGLIGINSFGFGGSNAHVLFEWNHKKNRNKKSDGLPRLVCVSGRLEDSITSLLNGVKEKSFNPEYVALFHNLFRREIKNHLHRGYSIISETGELCRSQNCFAKRKRSLYIIFENFGDSWLNITKQLQVVPVFAASLEKISQLLRSKNVDLEKNQNSLFNKTIGCMALQIGIVDILKKLQLEPNAFLGCGVNELICGYFQNTLTLQETVFATYEMAKFLGNFDKNENQLKKLLEEIISEPKPRGCKWLTSTTKPVVASSEYFVNSLKVQLPPKKLLDNFEKNCTIFEIGNRPVQVDSKKIKLLRFKNVENQNSFVELLEILGSLYNEGHNLQLDELYPKIEFPVSRGTPMIAPLIKWDHHKDWHFAKFGNEKTFKDGASLVQVDLKEDTWKWVVGHVIDGRNLFPATGYLFLVWELLSVVLATLVQETTVVFENCKFLRATQPNRDRIDLNVTIGRGSGNFEISERGDSVCTGRIYVSKKVSSENVDIPIPDRNNEDETILMKTKDIYKELRLRGYQYKGKFKKIQECDVSATKGLVQWEENWVCFIDNMLQLKILESDTRSLFVPTGIQRLSIEAKKHLEYVEKFGESPLLPVYNFKENNLIKCGGIEIRGLTSTSISKRKQKKEPVLEKYNFVPNCTQLKLAEAIRVDVQLILENFPTVKVKILEIIDEVTNEHQQSLATIIQEVSEDLPIVTPEITIFSKQPFQIPNVTVENSQNLLTRNDWMLVIGSDLFQKTTMLNQTLAAMDDNGFVLSREKLTFELYQKPTVEILTIFTTEIEKLILFKKQTQLRPSTVIDVTNTTEKFEWLPTLQKSLKNNENVILVAQNEPSSGILGLVNCIRRDPGGGGVKCFFIFDNAPLFHPSHPFYSEQLAKNLAINVYKNSQWGTYKHLLIEKEIESEHEHCFVNATQRGDLSSLKWLEGPLTNRTVLKPQHELIHVYYSALNFKDVMTATGRITADVVVKNRTRQECVEGMEFSGRTVEGIRVFGMVDAGALSNLVEAPQQLIWKLPDRFSLEEGATIAAVYATVIQAFFRVTKIKKGDTILIHAGSGGIGQAAITVALHCGLTIYTTVGTEEKRNFLKNRFPQLTDDQIGNSRDTSFETMIFQQTKGRGVDFVLNSLAEEKLEASVRCLGRGGKFLEIGKFDLINNRNLQLLLMEKEASYHGVMLDDLFMNYNEMVKLKKIMQNCLDIGMIQPLTRTVFEKDEIEKAFRFMAGGKHIGKVLIQIRKEEDEEKAAPRIRGVSRYNCDPNKVSIIVGGLGGFGLELADWLILRGARKIVLTSRNGLKTGYQLYRLRIWQSYGATVTISTLDITSKKHCEKLLKNSNDLGEIEAIFNLAVILKDAIFENQTVTNFQKSLEPKAFATKHLDEISRKLCPNLRNFVVFSSVSCGRGNAGQTNYGMANSIMERICEKRNEEGFPATAIQWGAVGDVGIVADMQESDAQLEIGGTLTQSISSCLQVLDRLLNQKNAIVSSMVVAEKRPGGIVGDSIVDVLANIIGIRDVKTVSPHSTLAELGMDSMSAAEVKQSLERKFAVFLTPQEIRSVTFSRLQKIQEEKLLENETNPNNGAVGALQLVLRLLNDEVTSQMSVIHMKSKREEDVTLPQVILFPGLEGASRVFDPLVVNLSINAKCIQYPCDRSDETMEEMTKYLLTIVEPLVTKSEPFHMISYSFGTVFALEIVNLLESKGYRGNLICIDGAPKMVQAISKGFLLMDWTGHFESSILNQILFMLSPNETNSKTIFHKKIYDCKNFEERLDMCEEIAPTMSYSKQFFRKLCISLCQRLKAANNYHPNYRIESKVTLFKPRQLTVSNLAEDYGLMELCENFGKIKIFEGNHVTILENIQTAEAINKVFGFQKN